MRNLFHYGLFGLVLALLAGCATSTPSNRQNLCALFEEKSGWYSQAKKASQAYDSPIPIIMSIMYQESAFVARAKPPRTKILWIFPGPRASDAYGYPQARNATWDWYQEKTGDYSAKRHNFSDAIHFVAWYNQQSSRMLGIKKTDAYNLYLAYHEGQGGYKRGTYKGKSWLAGVAKQVEKRAATYGQQLAGCEASLKSFGWFF